MSVRNPSLGVLEESKDPVVPKSRLTPVEQPPTHAAQNLPTLQQHVRRIREGQGIPPDQLLRYDKCFKDLVSLLHETDQAPSVMQFAVAVSAYLNMQGQLHQVWSQPPGTGKTRTLMALVYILSTLGKVPDITIRCPNKLLMDQDQFALDEIKAAVKRDTTVRFATGAIGLGKEGTVEVVDECDALIFDGDKFLKARKNIATFIGLTATPIKDTDHSSEKTLVTTLGIRVHDSAIPAMGHLSQDLQDITWEQFADPRRTKNARLVYVARTDKAQDKYRDTLPEGLALAAFNPKTYRQLAPNSVTIIDWRHARGVDFRAEAGHGIDLLITIQLPNDRSLVQLLGRVGRYGQDCSRWKLAEVETLVNEKAARKLRYDILDLCKRVSGGDKTKQ